MPLQRVFAQPFARLVLIRLARNRLVKVRSRRVLLWAGFSLTALVVMTGQSSALPITFLGPGNIHNLRRWRFPACS